MKTLKLPIKSILGFFFFLLFNSIHAQINVNNADELEQAVNSASPGDIIVLQNGNYTDFEARFSDISGSENTPITIKAETIGGVTLTKESLFSLKRCSYIVLEGFVFDCEGENTLIKLEGSNNIRITRNVFELKTSEPIKWVFIGGIYNDYTFQYTSHHNRIDHNIFQNKTTPGHYITVDGTSNEDGSDSRQSQYDRIDHNYFRNNSPRASNEKESIRIGWSQMSMSSGFTTVEHNLFEDCDGDPEIVSVKSSDNNIRHNTFIKSYGTLSLRHGNRNRVEGNYFFGGDKPNGSFGTSTIYTGGIRIYGTDHIIVNNYMEGLKGTIWDAPIALTQGDAIDGSSSNLTKHFRAERVTIAYNTLVNNTHGIEIGFDKGGDYNIKLKDITIANNVITGSENNMVTYIEGNDQDGEITWLNNIMHPTGNASLVNGGANFSETEVSVTNPNLDFVDGVWKATASSPAKISAVGSLAINQDIDGQPRPETSTVGADHFSSETIRFKPLTPEDVGPDAYEDGDEPSEILFVSSISEFESEGGSQEVSITANVDWITSLDQDWVSVSSDSGSDDGTITVAVLENDTLEPRQATLSISGGSITRGIQIIQKGADAPDGALEIDPIGITASDQQLPDNVKENTVDKNLDTRWSAEGAGQTITYDLGQQYDINLLKIAVHNGDERNTFFEIATSNNGTDFNKVKVNNSSETLITTSGTTNDLENYLFTSQNRSIVIPAQYVRIIGGGNSVSAWNSITEVEIYGFNNALSVTDNDELDTLKIFPSPVSEILYLKNLNHNFDQIVFFTIDGKEVYSQIIDHALNQVSVNVSSFSSGLYVLRLFGNNKLLTKKIVISD